MKLGLGAALLTSVILLACSSDPAATIDPPSETEEISLVTAKAIDSFSERFAPNVAAPEVVQIPNSINLAQVASLARAEFRLQQVVPAHVESYWRVSQIQKKSNHWEVIIESVSGDNFFAGSQFFARQDDGTFEPVEAKDVNETPTTVVS